MNWFLWATSEGYAYHCPSFKVAWTEKEERKWISKIFRLPGPGRRLFQEKKKEGGFLIDFVIGKRRTNFVIMRYRRANNFLEKVIEWIFFDLLIAIGMTQVWFMGVSLSQQTFGWQLRTGADNYDSWLSRLLGGDLVDRCGQLDIWRPLVSLLDLSLENDVWTHQH